MPRISNFLFGKYIKHTHKGQLSPSSPVNQISSSSIGKVDFFPSPYRSAFLGKGYWRLLVREQNGNSAGRTLNSFPKLIVFLLGRNHPSPSVRVDGRSGARWTSVDPSHVKVRRKNGIETEQPEIPVFIGIRFSERDRGFWMDEWMDGSGQSLAELIWVLIFIKVRVLLLYEGCCLGEFWFNFEECSMNCDLGEFGILPEWFPIAA